MVFRKQANPEGDYVTKDVETQDEQGNTVIIPGGERYDILSCERTESMEYVQTGTDTQIIDGETVEVPVMEQQIVVNKGWDTFDSIEAAAEAYGLEYKPLTEEEKNAVEEGEF